MYSQELMALLNDISEEYFARPEEDRQDLIDCIRESADLERGG